MGPSSIPALEFGMASCFDFFFNSQAEQTEFTQFICDLNLGHELHLDPFPCENGSFGVTVSTHSSMIPGDDELFDAPSTEIEVRAMETFLLAIAERYPNLRYA
jgi:hypothetical protein